MEKGNILLVEDDPSLGFVIKDSLEAAGFVVNWVHDGAEGESQIGHPHDLCLVDVMLPKQDGFSLAEKIRKENEFIPILFITARSLEEDRLRGFEIGGDDYITKPFSVKELLYRVGVFMRRSKPNIPASDEVWRTLGNFQFSLSHLTLKDVHSSYSMTQREADLLDMLIGNLGMVVKRQEILIKLWGDDDYFKGRSLDVFISRLRKYLKSDANIEIRNHHGVGFSLNVLSP